MVQGCTRLRLALEPGEPLGILRKRLRQHLDRHLAPERRIARAIDLPHAARANGGEDLVRAQARARGQGHRPIIIDP